MFDLLWISLWVCICFGLKGQKHQQDEWRPPDHDGPHGLTARGIVHGSQPNKNTKNISKNIWIFFKYFTVLSGKKSSPWAVSRVTTSKAIWLLIGSKYGCQTFVCQNVVRSKHLSKITKYQLSGSPVHLFSMLTCDPLTCAWHNFCAGLRNERKELEQELDTNARRQSSINFAVLPDWAII